LFIELYIIPDIYCHSIFGLCHGHDRIVVWFTTTYAICAYHH